MNDLHAAIGAALDSEQAQAEADLDWWDGDRHFQEDPARTLRRIEADRRVLARHDALDKTWCTYCGPMQTWPCGDVRDLAAGYDVETN